MKTLPLFLFALALLSTGFSQERRKPDHANVAYGQGDPAQVLDVYLADSDEPVPAIVYIHGGGWRAGSKNAIPGFLAKAVSQGWASAISVEYRFTDVETHPAQVNDCIRAIQYVRSKAKEWNIDPGRIGVTGGSAGGHLSLWVALHDDLADPDSDDPVARQSSRVTCAVPFAGPTDWSLLAEIEHGHPAYRQLLGYEPGTPAGEMDAAKKVHVSPITHASGDDPPVLIVHGDADNVVPIEHAERLDEKLDAAGADSELVVIEGAGHGVAGAGGAALEKQVTAFFREHLLGEEGGGAGAGPGEASEIFIVVGPSTHAPGTHEVAAGGRLMAWCLEHAANLEGVDAEVLYEWPEDGDALDGAASVVFIGDQFPAERLDRSLAAMKRMKQLANRGCGIVCIHYATGLGVDDVSGDGDHPLLHWTGGYFATRCNHHQSVARIFEATVTPAAPDGHPIRRGWNTFEVRDEPYTRNWFGKDGLVEGAIPLATVEFPPDDPETEVVAWAIERSDGGRGAGITMPHFFRNWEKEELRRFVLNTIAWSAGLEVPEGGVATTLPALETFEPESVDPQPRPKKAAAKGSAKAK